MAKIAIIGAGWYGCHIALSLKETEEYDVVLFEAKSDIFQGCSGKFGVRLHAGPHYPRSKKTRESCQKNFATFRKIYSSLIINHDYSIYGLGLKDVSGISSKVNQSDFRSICQECEKWQEIDVGEWDLNNLSCAFTVFEPSISVGKRLRKYFKKRFTEVGLNVMYNYKVEKIERNEQNKLLINNQYLFDHVINCTYYQDVIMRCPLPFDIEVVYQPCIALHYEDTEKSYQDNAFSFTVMDGWFPCLIPHDDHEEGEEHSNQKYICIHGKYTIMGTFETYQKAVECEKQLNDTFIRLWVKPLFEKDMVKHWPKFSDRFKYLGWKSAIATKLKTEKEFRSAVTWKKDGIIYIISGKIANVFDAAREVISLIKHENIINYNGYSYVEHGELHRSINEITEKPSYYVRNTSEIQTYNEICSDFSKMKPMYELSPV